jgi:hypothetical protein
MQSPLDSIPGYAKERLKRLGQRAENIIPSSKDLIGFSDGFMLPEGKESDEHKARMQAIVKDYGLMDEFIRSGHPWATHELLKNYWRHLRAEEPHNAAGCSMHLGISENQMKIDLIKAQTYVFLEEVGLPSEEALAEDMAHRVITGEQAADIFTSYIRNGTIEFEESVSEIDVDGEVGQRECDYCGAVFASLEEASRHEEACEMGFDEDDEYDGDAEFGGEGWPDD